MGSATTPTTVSTATMPTSLTDAEATRLGLKSYSHGTTYNGGIAPTVTLSGGGGSLSSVQLGQFIPRQMQDGSWRLEFNLAVTVSSLSRGAAIFAVNGVIFKNVGGSQIISVSGSSLVASFNPQYIKVDGNANTIQIQHVAITTDNYTLSGSVPLESRPTWAYFA